MEDLRADIHRIGHRAFVGGDGDYWDSIGELQFKYLLERGLKPSDTLIDVACGALRGGVHFIRYLEPERYLGLDMYVELLVYGIAEELGVADYRSKRPQLVVSDAFEFGRFNAKPTFGIAQSIFTHLAPADVLRCLESLLKVAANGCKLYATFFEVSAEEANSTTSHYHDRFNYTRRQMEEFGSTSGWRSNYMGQWGHPRGQRMMEYVAP